MSVGGVVGATVAVIAAKQREEIIQGFRRLAATSEATARPLDELGLSADAMFRAQLAKGVVIETSDGRFYLDEFAEEREQRIRQRIVLVLTLTLGLALLVFFLSQ